jgi:hypothetical protein
MLTTLLGIEYVAELLVVPGVDCSRAGIKPARNIKDSPPHYKENPLY